MFRYVSIATFICFLLIAPILLAQETKQEVKNPIVLMKTNMGDIYLELFPKAAPITVDNFISLAEGTKEWTDPQTGEKKKSPYYDGLTFHRVIDKFMIQGGCPIGDGTGDPGYKFKDEINAEGIGLDKLKVKEYKGTRARLRTLQLFVVRKLNIKSKEELDARKAEFEKEIMRLFEISAKEFLEMIGYQYDSTLEPHAPRKGNICMANAGPNTNGSQFFINLIDTEWLDGCHTVFGKVIKGFDVVESIGKVEVEKETSRPLKPVQIISIREVKEPLPFKDEEKEQK